MPWHAQVAKEAVCPVYSLNAILHTRDHWLLCNDFCLREAVVHSKFVHADLWEDREACDRGEECNHLGQSLFYTISWCQPWDCEWHTYPWGCKGWWVAEWRLHFHSAAAWSCYHQGIHTWLYIHCSLPQYAHALTDFADCLRDVILYVHSW